MFMSSNFKGQSTESFTRQGFANTVIIPADLKDTLFTDPNIEGDTIVFSKGSDANGLHILSDEIGFLRGPNEEVEINIFFVDGGMCFELIFGKVALRAQNGSVYVVDADGDVTYPTDHTIKSIHWADHNDLKLKAVYVIRSRYNSSTEEAEGYVDNFILNALAQHTASKDPGKGGNMFRVQYSKTYDISSGRSIVTDNTVSYDMDSDEDLDDLEDFFSEADEDDEEVSEENNKVFVMDGEDSF